VQFFQCDQIGRIFAIWAIFLGVGRLVSEKYRPNDLGAIFFKNIAQNSP
jgi:prolipoprotein diacylglyceryltransferase